MPMYEMLNLPGGRMGGFVAVNEGVVPSSRVAFSVNPTANDTMAIGGTTFKFVSALGAAAAQVQVLIGGTAAASLANVIDAINGKASNKGSAWAEATTPFAVTVVADASTTTQLRIRWADKRGGNALAGVAPSTALTASITGGASAWINDNLNTIGKAPSSVRNGYVQITLTAAMITALATGVFVEFPFTPSTWQWMVVDSTGAGRWTLTDTLVLDGNALKLVSAGATHVVATNVLSVWASE